MTSDRGQLPRWPVPGYYGTGDALQVMGTVAAPLLAGFSITLATLVVTSPNAVRWPGAALVAAVLSAVTLLVCLQLTFWARQAVLTPDVAREWWDDIDTVAGRDARIREMRGFNRVFGWYSTRARLFYDLGIILLLAAVAIVLAPTADARQLGLRWVAVGIAALSVVVEVFWTLTRRFGEKMPDPFRSAARWIVRRPADYMEEL